MLDCSVVMKFLSNLGKGTDKNTNSEKEPERKSDAISSQIPQRWPKKPKESPRTKGQNVTRWQCLKKSKKFTRVTHPGYVHNNPDSLFMQPRRCRPRHFEIHPEFRGILTK